MAEQNPAPRLAPAPSAGGLRFPALLWALLHAPLFLALYGSSAATALRAVPAPWRTATALAFLPQAALLATVLFLAALPVSRRPRAYRWAAPAGVALGTLVFVVDSRVHAASGFHLNGFFLRVFLQPTALQELGITAGGVAAVAVAAAAFAAADVAAGAWFLRRFATPRRAWILAAALLLLAAAERVYGAVLVHYAGGAVFAASQVLPLQPPVRMERAIRVVLGGGAADPFARTGSDTARLPGGLDPATVSLEKRDVVLVVAESLPATHFDAETMPRLWRRAAGGTVFPRHQAGASSTNFSLFSLLYGLNATRLDASVGAGLRPVLFPALRANGFQLRVLSASCVDWMGLKETVFAGVGDDLETWCGGAAAEADDKMLASARRWLEKTDDRPAFLFLFFYGTHFTYYYPPRSDRFAPAWDGVGGGIAAASVPPDQLERRARNAAYELDWKLDDFLEEFARRRGKPPLVLFTGDHGEEFKQKGHIGHASAVVAEQVHVPMVVVGDGVPAGVHDVPTGHVDVVPTLLDLLGDRHPPALYADGLSMFRAPEDRFVLTTIGWEPLYGVVGKDLKVTMWAGLGDAHVTDPEDRPLPDGPARLSANAAKILKALGR
jgi:membrane-anchored protein YejM (alkaline phosphatase superfamily)